MMHPVIRLPAQLTGISLLVLAILLIDIAPAEAIPAFARKYQSNCALCHSNVPRLTPFGQQFLQNGYQFPGTSDGGETGKIVLDGPQGAVTLDKLSNMMAVRLRGDLQRASFRNINDDMRAEGVDGRASLEAPKIVNFFFGGTVTKNISYFLESEYNTMEAEGGETSVIFERGMMQFSNLGGIDGLANVKIGKFDPSSLFSFPTHRQQLNPIGPKADTDKYPPEINRIPLLPLAFSSKFFGLSTATTPAGSLIDNGMNEGFAILPFEPYLYNAPSQNGVSVHGRPMGSSSAFLYQLGIALNDEAGGQAQRTDKYAMLRFDFLAGSAEAQVSGFYYRAPNAARATLVNILPDMNDSTDNSVVYAQSTTGITRVGIAARAQWQTIDLYGTYIRDTIDEPTWAAAPLQTSQWETMGYGTTLEIDWRFHPNWMFGTRYDYLAPGGLVRLPTVATATGSVNDEINQSIQLISPILKYYPSPNIGLYGRAHLNLSGSSRLPNTNGRVTGFEGQIHPAANLKNMLSVGVDMAF